MGSSWSVFLCYVTSKEIWYSFSFALNYLLSTELFGRNEYLETSKINWPFGKLYITIVWPSVLLSQGEGLHALRSICLLRRIESYQTNHTAGLVILHMLHQIARITFSEDSEDGMHYIARWYDPHRSKRNISYWRFYGQNASSSNILWSNHRLVMRWHHVWFASLCAFKLYCILMRGSRRFDNSFKSTSDIWKDIFALFIVHWCLGIVGMQIR